MQSSNSRKSSFSKQQLDVPYADNSSSPPNPSSLSSSEDSGTFDMGKYKTKLCRHWKSGYCLFGPACVFAHGVDDLCEPNLLVSQMGGLMLVPVDNFMPTYCPPMPLYADNSSIQSQSLVGSSVLPMQALPFMPFLPSSQLSTGSHKMDNSIPNLSSIDYGTPSPFSFYNPQLFVKKDVLQSAPSPRAHIRGLPTESDLAKKQQQSTGASLPEDDFHALPQAPHSISAE